MACEPRPNRFRAAVVAGKREPLVVRGKRGRVDKTAKGLAAVPVPRSEGRRRNERRNDRHRLDSESAVLRHKRRKTTVELINLSGGGAMIAGKLKVRLWDHVHLILGEHGEVECAVRWIKGDRVGLEFSHETRIDCDSETHTELLRAVIRKSFPDVEIQSAQVPAKAKTASVAVEEHRGAERHPLIWTGLVFHNYETDPARLRNISTTGALIQCSAHLPQGATVYLDLGEAGRHAATVSWCRGDQSGLAFHEPFDIHVLAKARPEVVPPSWIKPDYLADDDPKSSPWAAEWGRLSLTELGKTLRG